MVRRRLKCAGRTQRLSGDSVRLIEEFAQVRLGGEHLLDAREQLGVAATGSVQVGGTLRSRAVRGHRKRGIRVTIPLMSASGQGGLLPKA